MGFNEVQTYIQSGNVLFSSSEQNMEVLSDTIGEALLEMFGYKARVAVISQKQLIDIVNNAPTEIGADGAAYKYDVLFLIKPLTPEQLLKVIKPKEEVDFVYAGESVLYFSRLIERASQSRLNKIIGTPEYQYITIRNWRTTVKLKELIFHSTTTSSAKIQQGFPNPRCQTGQLFNDVASTLTY